jgi:hypothetical protein
VYNLKIDHCRPLAVASGCYVQVAKNKIIRLFTANARLNLKQYAETIPFIGGASRSLHFELESAMPWLPTQR